MSMSPMKIKFNRRSFKRMKTDSQQEPDQGAMSTDQQHGKRQRERHALSARAVTGNYTAVSRRSVRCRPISKSKPGKKSGIPKMDQAAAAAGSRGSNTLGKTSSTSSSPPGCGSTNSTMSLTPQGNTVSPGPGPEVRKMSTFDLLSDPSLLTAGLQLLGQMGGASDVKKAANIGRKLGLIGRSPPVVASDRVLRRVTGHNENQLPATATQGKRRKGTKDQDDDGVDLVKELFRRSKIATAAAEVASDNFDLPTPAVDDVRVQEEFTDRILPGYKEKSNLVKAHFKNIESLNVNNLIEHYNTVKPELKQVFEVGSPRTDMLVQGGQRGRRMLIELSVSVPFSNEQSSTLIQILFDYFVPNLSERRRYTDYITLVMLPEALIRIYALVNKVSNELAEKELRFRAYYQSEEGENLNESFTTTP